MRVLLASVIAGILLANPPENGTAPPTLDERLARFDAKTAQIHDLAAGFKQQKFSSLLRKPLLSRGDVKVWKDIIRWDTREPLRSVIRVDEHGARIYYPDEKLLEIYELGEDLRFLAGSPAPRLGSLRARFEIGPADGAGLEGALNGLEDPFVVELLPRHEKLADRISRVRLVLDEATGVMRVIEMMDPQGERSVIAFSDVRINPGLTKEDVALRVPPDVRVSRPFGGSGGDDEDGSAGGG